MSEISNVSYTNKDFATVYPELLSLAKTLTKKWDPSISNESDPGVVLLKLNAIIADKCNYNIDKNVLECFPSTVTQSNNARKLYEQLGYYMSWYQSAISVIGMGWIDLDTVNNSSSILKIPAFTMVSNEDRDVVYSILGPYSSSGVVVSDVSIPMNGAQIAITTIEGVAVKYSLNDSTIITQTDLDENNRIYFTTNDIAQNGIFICNAGNSNYNEWEQKDNLAIEAMNSLYYHFGVEDDKCFIEFPSDFSTIAGEGVEITYIRSSGSSGNVPVGTLTTLYEDTTVVVDSESIVLNSDNTYIANVTAGEGGDDPESLESAYNNYKKTVGTYNTLITLRDYFNAITKSVYASNAIVTDRSCDQQSSYKTMSSSNGVNTLITCIDKSNNANILNAYDLKIYATTYCPPTINTATKYNVTFNPIVDNTYIENYISDLKSISHDYVDRLTPWYDANSNSLYPEFRSNVCLFKNKYGIEVNITTTRNLESVEQNQLKENINTKLYSSLNASYMSFGSIITSSELEEIIANADSRISGATVSNIDDHVYAIYWNGEKFIEVPFERVTDDSGNITDDFIYDTHDNALLSGLSAASTFLTTVSNTNKYWGKYDFTYVYSQSKWFLTSTTGKTTQTNVDVTSTITSYLEGVDELVLFNDATFTIEVNPIEHIKDEVYVKSILKGNTPVVQNDNVVTYSLGDKKKLSTGLIDNVLKVKASTTVTIPATGYTQLKSNDNLTFYCPSVIDLDEFGNYVRFAFISPSKTSIESNTNIQLSANEYLFAFWKEEDDYSAIYKYKAYGTGAIIYSNFSVSRTFTTAPTYLADAIAAMKTSIGILLGSTSTYDLSASESAAVQSSAMEYLSGTRTLNVRKINTASITDSFNLYWVLNQVDEEGKYTLFEENETQRVLKVGEYLFYTNGSSSVLNILGPGTKVVRNNVDLTRWSVEVEDLDVINEYGSTALIDLWMTMQEGSIVTASEQRYVNIGSNCYVKITGLSSAISVVAGTPVDISPSCTIQYLVATGDPTSESADWVTLEDFDINSINWTVDSSLTLTIGNGVSQELYTGQTLYVYTDESSSTTINGQDATSTYSALTLQSSNNIEITSANDDIYVYTVDESNNYVYPTVWVYTKKKNFDVTSGTPAVTKAKVIYSTTSSTSVMFTAGTDSVTVTMPIEIPDGEYLIELTHEADDATSITVNATINGTSTAISVYNGTTSDFKTKGTYYLYINANNLTNISITYTGVRLINKVLTFKSPIKIVKPDVLTSSEWTKYKNLIKYVFDKDGLYNYMYEIPSDNLITYPLKAISFFDPHHPFNACSICQIDTLNQTYRISARS